MSSKRAYYSQLEKDIILELVNKYRSTLECKKTDFRSIKAKNDTWEKVSQEFNAQSGVAPRDSKQIKKCWENMKNRRKEAKGQERRERLLTGGGPEPTPIDGVSNVVDGIISSQTDPLKNAFDDDAGADDVDSQDSEYDDEMVETSSSLTIAHRQSVIRSGDKACAVPSSVPITNGKRKATMALPGASSTVGNVTSKRKASDTSASTSSVHVRASNRKAPDAPTTSTPRTQNCNRSLTYAQREVISLQQAEHDMQMHLLKTKLENCQAEHQVKMEILHLQKQLLERELDKNGNNKNNNNSSSQSCNVSFGINSILGK